MKPKPEQKTEVTATTKVRLTIRGQTFEMTMDELRSLHDKIGKVTGQDKPTVIFAPPEDQAVKQPRRPFYPPAPWYHNPPDPTWPGDRIMCLVGETPLELRRTTSGSFHSGQARLVSTCSMGL